MNCRSSAFLLLFSLSAFGTAAAADSPRPNILLAIADDWSWRHASAYGCKFVTTPAFDAVAKRGVLFRNGFTASPGCSPSRAALLTGKYTWQLEHAGTHASSFSAKLAVYPDLLEAAGYHVGLTGKGWGPGNFKAGGRTQNPAGPTYASKTLEKPLGGVTNTDYAGNFAEFLATRPKDKPFCFWYGCKEPHRSYEKGSGLAAGKKLEDVEVPPFLPDTPEVRSDLLDYAVEIEWFDKHLGLMLDMLKKSGQLENTLVVVCSDNGMAFPRAKANCYEYGQHMPLAISWPAKVKGGRTVSDFAGHVDLAPTFLAAAGLPIPDDMTGRSLLPVLTSEKEGQVDPARDHIFFARERHSSSRPENLGYPCRAIRTPYYLYIRNFAADRWPAGDPIKGGDDGYFDIDGSPTKSLLIERRKEEPFRRFYELAVAKRPAEELFAVKDDPACIRNVAKDAEHAAAKKQLRERLDAFLTKTGDARMTEKGEVWETYPRYSPIRTFE